MIEKGRNEPTHKAMGPKSGSRMVGSSRGLLPETPTDPDVRNYRIRLFGARIRYVTEAERRRGCGSG